MKRIKWLSEGILLGLSFLIILPWYCLGYVTGCAAFGLRVGIDSATAFIRGEVK